MSGGGSTPLAAHDVSFVRMIADFIFMRPRDGSGSEVEVRSSQIPASLTFATTESASATGAEIAMLMRSPGNAKKTLSALEPGSRTRIITFAVRSRLH